MAVIILLIFILLQRFTTCFSSDGYFCEDECTSAISNGPSCLATSPGVECLAEEQCNNMTEQLKFFERSVCNSPYLSEFRHKPECWTMTFKKCHNVVIVGDHQELEKACRGKPGYVHFCRPMLKKELPHCRLPSRRFLHSILVEQGCVKSQDVPKYNGCGHYCERNIVQGPRCDKNESNGVACLRQCADPFLQRLAEYLQQFEKVVCDDKRLHTGSLKRCWPQVFHHCKDVGFVASMVNVTSHSCSVLDHYLRGCLHRLKNTECYNIGSKLVTLVLASNPCESKRSPANWALAPSPWIPVILLANSVLSYVSWNLV